MIIFATYCLNSLVTNCLPASVVMTSDDLKYVSIQHALNWFQTCFAVRSFNHRFVWNLVTSSTICNTGLLSLSSLISIYSIFTNMLKLNCMSSSLMIKLNLLEDFSCIWQWWQYLVRCSIKRWLTSSCLARSSIWYKRRVERWSKRRCKRRNSTSIKKHGFSFRESTIRLWIEIFQSKKACSYRLIIEYRSFFISIWRMSVDEFWISSFVRLLK